MVGALVADAVGQSRIGFGPDGHPLICCSWIPSNLFPRTLGGPARIIDGVKAPEPLFETPAQSVEPVTVEKSRFASKIRAEETSQLPVRSLASPRRKSSDRAAVTSKSTRRRSSATVTTASSPPPKSTEKRSGRHPLARKLPLRAQFQAPVTAVSIEDEEEELIKRRQERLRKIARRANELRPGTVGKAGWKLRKRTSEEEATQRALIQRRILGEFESRLPYHYELPTISNLVSCRYPELFRPPTLSTTPRYALEAKSGES